MEHEILLGLTTTPKSDWRGKVEEMKKFGIKRIALFPTFLEIDKRKELYDLLEQIENLQIPHVHLRQQDMEGWEMEWFESKGVKVYNIHPGKAENKVLQKYQNKVFMENHISNSIPEEYFQECSGICLDFQHWKRATKEVSEDTRRYAQKYPIGCCHLSPLPKRKNFLQRILKRGGYHYMISIDEYDYVAEFKNYFPYYMSLELENSFAEQLEVKKYLEKILEI